jgi:hypothetical protein
MTASCATPAAPPAEPMPADVRQLLEARLPAVAGDVRWHARSGTLLDTGSWVARAAVHAAVCGDRLVLIAAGPRPFVLDLPVAALSSAVYNFVTGELSFPHASAVPAVPPVRLDSLVARSLVALAPRPIPSTL